MSGWDSYYEEGEVDQLPDDDEETLKAESDHEEETQTSRRGNETQADRLEFNMIAFNQVMSKEKWISPQVQKRLSETIVGANRDICKECGYKAINQAGKTRLRIHVRQHFLSVHCMCGFSSVSVDCVKRHAKVELHGGGAQTCGIRGGCQ